MGNKKSDNNRKIIAMNKKARHNYHIEEVYEAGIVLRGSEVKSLRNSKVSIGESFAQLEDGEIFWYNAHISEYKSANKFSSHSPTRPRKLLLHHKEIRKLIGKLRIKGYAFVPLSLYFNRRNIAKLEMGIGPGKKLYDKREDKKQKDWQRQQQRIMKYQ